MIRFRAVSLLVFVGVGGALSCGKSDEEPFESGGSSGAPGGKGGASGRGGSAGAAQAGTLASGGVQAGGDGGAGAAPGKGGSTLGGNGGTAGVGTGGAGGDAATSGVGNAGASGEPCGGTTCGPSEFCCGPAECGTCEPAGTEPNCPMTCGEAGAGGSGGRPSACDEDCEASGFECCDGVCVNTTNDIENCGECGVRCAGPVRYCDNGSCGVPECASGINCGAGAQCCGAECCGAEQLCCVVPGGPPQPPRCVEAMNGTCPRGCPTCP